MGELVRDHPLVVLFFVIACGYLLGKVRIGGFSLGLAAVLFAGLGASAVNPDLVLPEIVYELGLVIFVYAVGLAAGPGFVNALRRRGWRENLLVMAALVVAGEVVFLASLALGLGGRSAAGIYAGALTNTPALAGVVETLHGDDTTPVIGYSLTYPMGILGVIAVTALLERRPHRKRSDSTGDGGAAALSSWAVLVACPGRHTVAGLATQYGGRVKVSLLRRDGRTRLAQPQDELSRGTLVTIVGDLATLHQLTRWLGERVNGEHLELDRAQLDSRRMFLSNPQLAGRPLSALGLDEDHDVFVTRVRRGDTDMVATPDTVLELGDRVRVVGPRPALTEAARLFGDSYHRASEVNILTFAVGIGLGLLLGMVKIPLPGASVFSLGEAGGCLLVALALGAMGRTGPVVWRLPYGVGTTLRQIGVVLFLAGIGTRAGEGLRAALTDSTSLQIIGTGAALTMIITGVTLVLVHRLLDLPFDRAVGIVAGMQTQPALLAFSTERYKADMVNLGYATVYPTAMVTKIIMAQVVLALLA